jgi:outer membrane protein assembly factor BamA
MPRASTSSSRSTSTPGPQYWLGNVAFRTGDPDQPLVFSAGELRTLIPLQEGEVFNVTKIRDGLDAMRSRYKEYGYINFVTTPITVMNDATQRVSVTFELEQGKQFRIGKVEVHGIDPGRAAVLASRLHPGDIFRNSMVENAVKAMAPGLSDDELFHMLSLRKDEKEATIAVVVDFRQ